LSRRRKDLLTAQTFHGTVIAVSSVSQDLYIGRTHHG
jgi:hypothetical protein